MIELELEELREAIDKWDGARFNYQPRWQRAIVEAARLYADFIKVEASGQPRCSRCGRGPSDFDYWLTK